jgi:hypothetical protein
MRKLGISAAAMINLWGQAPAFAAGYGLADGGFDNQGASVSSYCYFALSNCPSGAWSGGTNGLVHSGQGDWGNPIAVSPSTVAFVQRNQSIAQTFTATSSGTVRLVWLDQARQGYGGIQTYIVTVNGVTVATVTPTNSIFQRRYSAPFSLTSGTAYTVAFVGQSSDDNTAFIDSVDIQPASETTNYSYDALGRLTNVSHSGAINGGTTSSYQFDPADNRTNVTTSGAPQ